MSLSNFSFDDAQRIRRVTDVSGEECWISDHPSVSEQLLIKELSVDAIARGLQSRFEQEAVRLSLVECQNYNSLIHHEVDGKRIRLAYRFHEGITLHQWIETKGKLSIPQTLELACDLLVALVQVHGSSCIHRDWRPSHIIIHPDRGAILSGYGLVWQASSLRVDTAKGLESVRYASPELAGIIKHDIGPVSDLYSLGLVLYYALVGKPLCDAHDFGDVLFQVSTLDLNPDCLPSETPAPFVELIERLTHKEPRERYQSASAVLHDADAIRQALQEGRNEDTFVIGSTDRRNELSDPAFVGRESQLQSLRENLDLALEGHYRRVMIASPSGMGKSRLTQEITRLATRHGSLVFSGDSVPYATSEPNGCWMQIVRQIANHCRTHSKMRERLIDVMSKHREEVSTAMPTLADVFGWGSGQLAGPDEFGQGRIVSAFSNLLTQLGTDDCPVMLTVDNCQWMDDQALRILQHVNRQASAYQLLLLSSRTEEGRADRIKNTVRPNCHLTLGPLDTNSIHRLCQSMAGDLPSDACVVVEDYAAGSPFMASAVLRGMVESQVLGNATGRWVLDEDRLTNFQMASDAGEVLAERLDNLPTDAQEFLAVAAILGSDFQLDAVLELAKLDRSASFEMLTAIRRQRMLWSKPDGSYAFSHDKIREVVLERLSNQRRNAMHGEVGRYLVQTGSRDAFALAYHFDAAGMHAEALPYAMQAASEARARFSLVNARQQLEIANRSFHLADRSTRHRAESMMSEVLMLLGEYDSAEQWLTASALTAEDTEDEALVATRRGELAFKRGDKTDAVNHFESALRRLGQPICRNRIDLGIKLCREILNQTAHTLFPSLTLHSKTTLPPKQELILRLYSNISRGYWYTRDKYITLWAHLRGLNLCERYASGASLARFYSEHAPGMTLLGLYKRGVHYAQRSLEIRRSLQDLWGQGQSKNFISILYYSYSNFNACIRESGEAISILERTGDFWEVHIARYQHSGALFRQGNVQDALEHAKTNYRSAVRRSDFQATGNIIDIWARASFGNLPGDVLQIELKRNVNDTQRRCHVKLAEGVCRFYRDDFNGASDSFHAALRTAENASVVNAYVSPCYAWAATALRRKLETSPPRTSAQRRKRVKELRRASQKALRVAKRFTNELPHSYRELAAGLALSGHPRRAKRLFHHALAVAKHQGAKLEWNETVILRADIARELGWTVDEVELKQALHSRDQMKAEVGAIDQGSSLSLVDRFDSLLEAGRRIAISTDLNVIRDEVIGAASRLLRGDRVFVIENFGDENQHTVPADVPFDSELVEECRRADSVVSREYERVAAKDNSSHDVQQNYGSFLCCPIKVRDKVVSYLYVANSYMMGMVGDDEIRIAHYLTSATGAAFEKADGFRQLKELNLTLEAKVAERTATLEQRNDEIERAADKLRTAQAGLSEAKDAAEKANLAKSDFLARMSHEIRTPITAVLGYTELMLRDIVSDPDEQRLHLETIHGNGTHLLQLLNDILDLSKIEADRIEVEQIDCEPARVVGEVIRSLHGKAAEKGLSLTLHAENGIPEKITSDPTRLRQILTNLVGNAIKFTDKGGIRIRMVTSIDAHSGLPRELQIEIEDTGIGMTEKQLERIFDPFAQADTSTTRKYGGTGLGLSISKRLAESLGGGLDVNSTFGKGSCFTVRVAATCLPGDRLLDESEIKSLLGTAARASWADIDLKGIHVLVVDDAQTNRHLIRRLLLNSGAMVECVENGQEALDRLLHADGSIRKHKFEVVLMDMQMPVLDGYSATRQLRAAGFDLPVIAMTANSMVGDDQKCRDAGCSDYLSKPIDLDDLLKRIRQWADESRESRGITDDSERTAKLPDDWLRKFAIDLAGRVQAKLPEIRDAFHESNFNEVAESIHWIKGSGGTVGLAELTDLAKGCEQAAHESDIHGIEQSLNEIENYIGELIDECGDEWPATYDGPAES
ncbi:MAG: ATP-binding protein [Planctomycetota bacterium]